MRGAIRITAEHGVVRTTSKSRAMSCGEWKREKFALALARCTGNSVLVYLDFAALL
jgi:hypothetical protein